MKKKNHSGSGSTKLLSMTGFARAQSSNESISVEMEIRAVNSRFLDLNFRLPREYQLFERDIRKIVSNELSRGRIEIFCVRSQTKSAQESVRFHSDLLDSYLGLAREYAQKKAIWSPEREFDLFLEFVGRREILEVEESVETVEDELPLLEIVLREALASMRSMRQEEGEALCRELQDRIAQLSQLTHDIESSSMQKGVILKEKLLERISRLTSEVALDSQRLELEVALLVDKADVTEELVRIQSHLTQFSELLNNPPAGRKLDFLTQELLREFNTIGSKVQDASAQQLVVEAKSVIEKMKEQVQNVE